MGSYAGSYDLIEECVNLIKITEVEDFTIKTFLDMVDMCEDLGVDIDLTQVENVFNIFRQAIKISSRAEKSIIRRPIVLNGSEVDARK